MRSSAMSSLLRPPPGAPLISGSGALLVGVPVSAIGISSFPTCASGRFRTLLGVPCVKTLGYCIFILMPLTAIRHVRKMRGGAQSHLLEADDGKWYVVKFRNNPQHRRVLVNEALCATLLRYLKLSAPETALIQVDAAFLAANPECNMQLGTRRGEIEPGSPFGAQYPGDPARIAVYDFLPDALLSQVANLEDFRAILVFDK